MLTLRSSAPNAVPPSRDRIALAALFVAMGAGSLAMLGFKLSRQPAFVDYLVMWTGGRFAQTDLSAIYDFARIDGAQAWLLGARAHDRPFPYPPSALLIFGPLAWLSFWPSAWLWVCGGAAVFSVGTWRLARRRWRVALALVGVMPGVVWAGLSGQCALLVGGLAMVAVTSLDRRPLVAGALIGLAVMLKPTLLLMAPVALLAGGHWRALVAAALTSVAILALSILSTGPGPWIDWLTVAPPYLAKIAADPRYRTAIIAPTALVIGAGVTGWALTLCRLGFAVLGGVLATAVFRVKRFGPAPRLVALIGGSLIATPYAMNYETALLAPCAALAVAEATTGGLWLAVSAYLALALAGLPNIGPFAFPVFLALSMWRYRVTPPSRSRDAGRSL